MTGFGKAEIVFPEKKIILEIKTLNSKNIDISFKLPNIYKSREIEIRQLVSERLERGKIDLLLLIELNEGVNISEINIPAVKSYYKKLYALAEELNITAGESILSSILTLPDTIKTERGEPDEKEWIEIKKLIHATIDEVDKFRIQEGKVLKNDVEKRINLILSKLDEVKQFEKQRIEKIREKITNGLKELNLSEGPDNNRVEQELIYYMEKLDITEEKVRLRNHCHYFLETINLPEPVGKKLGFISQEIGREINTLGSKASDYDIQKLVVEMKDELEKVKEQLLNVV